MSIAPSLTPPSKSSTENLAGLVERVTFGNEHNSFCVLRLKAHVSATSSPSSATPPRSRPASGEGIERYLGSGMIRGIGPTSAKRLVKSFGETVFDVIEAASLWLWARRLCRPCEGCAHTAISSNSRRNRHCPKCQGQIARAWPKRGAERAMWYERPYQS